MDTFTMLFWGFFVFFISLSGYLLCCSTKKMILYLQIGSGCGMFATSKVWRTIKLKCFYTNE